MITLPYEYKSGKTLLAELDPEHYITNTKKVVAKLNADNLWTKPVAPIEPVGGLILTDAEYEELTADWKRFQEWQKQNVEKHLQGQHDQSTHGKGGGTIPKGMSNWVGEVEGIKEAAAGLDESLGNRYLAVVLERAGMAEKPTIVNSVEELSGRPMYRGVTDPAHAEQFINAPVAYQPDGQYGNGTYFTDDKAEADLYARNKTGGATRQNNAGEVVKPTVVVAGWKQGANVLNFRTEEEFTNYKDKLFEKWKKSTGMPSQKMIRRGSALIPALPQDQSPRYQEWYNKNIAGFTDRGAKVSTLFAMEGIDGYRIGSIKEFVRPFREVPLGYTVVLNRGALEVVKQ